LEELAAGAVEGLPLAAQALPLQELEGLLLSVLQGLLLAARQGL
jgi:hypothetical protein